MMGKSGSDKAEREIWAGDTAWAKALRWERVLTDMASCAKEEALHKLC